ncbi:MAG: hypothetical protein IJN61_06215 [Clostridia bacterium]|nr:hypothetical protein [Clostridia bacterium]
MKNKRNLSANNGVSLSYRVDVNERIKIPFFNEILLTLLAIMASVGAIMTFATILDFTVTPSIVIAFIAAFSVAYTVLYKLIKKRRALVIAGAVVLAGLITLLFFKDVSKGAVVIFDQSRATISKYMFWDAVKPTYKWRDEFVYLTNTVTVLLSLVLCSAISYFTVVKQSFIAIFLLTFPFFEVGAAFGAVPHYLYFSLMLASWASMLTVSRAANAKIKMRRSNGEKQNVKVGGNKQKFAGVAIVVAVLVFFLFSGITAYLNAVGFSRAENVDKLRHDTKYAFADLIDYITGKDHDGSLKEGRLYEVDDRIIKNRHYITMETTISSTKEPIKLKGYTATIYKNNSWNQTDAYEKYQTMFDEFAKSAYMMGDATGRLITSNPKFAGDFFTDITLSNFRRKKPYAYATYFASFTGDYTSVYDNYAVPPDNDQYTYPAYLWEDYLYMVADSVVYKTEDYQAAYAKYKDFVNEEYIKSEVAESVRALAMSFEASDKFEYINAMRPFLQQNMEHTWKSGKCPKDVDFVENFLFNTKVGYSTHFATAAAVLLQARGYPARYVEGYYIPAEVFNKTESDRVEEYKTIDITDMYAHAWVEVFDDIYGWIPVEVTPGYWKGDFGGPQAGGLEKPEPDAPEVPEQLPTDFEIVEDEVENEVADEPFEPTTIRWPWEVVPIAVAAAVVAFCVYRLVIAVSKRRVYASRDIDKKLKFAHKWLVSLATYQKIPVGNVYDHMEFAKRVGGAGRYITTETVERILNVFLKHAYSRTPATLEEANEVLSGLRDYSRAIYASLSKPKKWAYRHLRNLY